MKQLTFGDLLNFANALKQDGMTLAEIKALPVYLGDDDELNGIHCGWYTNLVDANDTNNKDNTYMVEMINERRCNIKLDGKAIVIS